MRFAATLLALSVPAFADAKVELGRRLFFDRTVSRTGRVSCSSCHDPEHGFSDRRAYSEDEVGETLRHSMSIVDVVDGQPLHWDGEFGSVRELLIARFNPFNVELFREIRRRHFEAAKAAGRLPSTSSLDNALACGCFYPSSGPDRAVAATPGRRPAPVPLLRRLGEDDRYTDSFRTTFGSREITTTRIAEALEAYVLSLRTGESALDRHFAGNGAALTKAQRRGLALFTGKAGCAACHVVDGARPRLTDGGFHNTGLAFRPVELADDVEPTVRAFHLQIAADGVGGVNFVVEDEGKFKTPSLRDVGRRGPYMHDGSLATLEDVVRYYNGGGFPNPRLDERIRPLGLAEDDVADLVAFLKALTGYTRPGIGPFPEQPATLRARVVDLKGKPIPGLRVEIRPAGDRLEGGRTDDASSFAVTNDSGCISVPFPRRTHVRVTSDTHEIHYDWLIPDCAPEMELMAAPRDKVALKVRMRDSCPDRMRVPWAGSTAILAEFRLVRRMEPGTAIYVADQPVVRGGRRVLRQSAETPWVCAIVHGTARELDLSGGWTDPIDDRPPPKEP